MPIPPFWLQRHSCLRNAHQRAQNGIGGRASASCDNVLKSDGLQSRDTSAGAPASAAGASGVCVRVVKGTLASCSRCQSACLQQCFGCFSLSHRVLSLQVLELQHRVLQLQQSHCHSTVTPPSQQTEAVRAAENSAQHQCAVIQCDTSQEGTGGPWIIGRKSHPELSGRAVRDVAVQAHAPPPPAVSQPQLHAHVQTDACETSDRACSPLPEAAHIKEEDDGRAARIT